jgi:hypothetical protein
MERLVLLVGRLTPAGAERWQDAFLAGGRSRTVTTTSPQLAAIAREHTKMASDRRRWPEYA